MGRTILLTCLNTKPRWPLLVVEVCISQYQPCSSLLPGRLKYVKKKFGGENQCLIRIKKEQYKYLQDFVVDLRNIFLSLHLDDIFLDLDLKHCLLSVCVRHCLRIPLGDIK